MQLVVPFIANGLALIGDRRKTVLSAILFLGPFEVDNQTDDAIPILFSVRISQLRRNRRTKPRNPHQSWIRIRRRNPRKRPLCSRPRRSWRAKCAGNPETAATGSGRSGKTARVGRTTIPNSADRAGQH